MANTDPIQTAKEILERVSAKKEEVTTEVEAMNEETVEEVVNEAEVIIDVEDNETADGKKATKTEKGKKKMKDPKAKPSDASAEMPATEGDMEESVEEDTDETIAEDNETEEITSMEEHVTALFNGEDLSEEFQKKATTIFEAAVSDRVRVVNEELENNYNGKLDEAIETNKEELSKKLDDYLGYVVEEWMKDNELALEMGIKSELAESFLTGLHGLFESHYITVPEEKTDLLEEMINKVAELETNLNESLEKNVDLRKELIESRCVETFNESCKGLVDTEVEKFRALAEGINYETAEQYREKLDVLRESYFNDSVEVVTEDSGVEENTAESATPTSDTMSAYTQAISDQIRKL